jgi:hypothetical protein
MAEELFAPNSVWVSENTENFGPAYTAGLFFRKRLHSRETDTRREHRSPKLSNCRERGAQ